jgi:hypothetical protein
MATAPKKRKHDLIWLEKNMSRMSSHQYWRSLRAAYDSEPHTVHHRERLVSLFRAVGPGKGHLMSAAERKALAQLPSTLTVYRGYAYGAYGEGIAWTLHKPAAIWYAHAYEPTRESAAVLVGRIYKRDVYAYCDRGDILLNPAAIHFQWVEEIAHLTEARAAWDDYVPEFDLAAYLKSVG